MLRDHPQICLYQPEIPQNTGAISRLMAATQCRLHLIKPFGFSLEDKNLRRPGLDYWPFLDLEIHDHLDLLLERFSTECVFLSKKATNPYTAIPITTQLIVFGQETSGIPEQYFERYCQAFYQIPMFHSGVRSINLANAVSIVVYDQLKQRNLLTALTNLMMSS